MARFSYKKQITKYLSWALRSKFSRHKYRFLFMALGAIVLFVFNFFPQIDNDPPNITLKNKSYLCSITKLDDGDSFTASCLDKHKENTRPFSIKTRMWGMDAPEMGQKPWGQQSKDALRTLINNEKVLIEIIEKDRYNRYVSKVYRNEKDLGLEMVRTGKTIVYERYNNDPHYKKVENEARIERAGIWSQKGSQQSPEKWRRLNPR